MLLLPSHFSPRPARALHGPSDVLQNICSTQSTSSSKPVFMLLVISPSSSLLSQECCLLSQTCFPPGVPTSAGGLSHALPWVAGAAGIGCVWPRAPRPLLRHPCSPSALAPIPATQKALVTYCCAPTGQHFDSMTCGTKRGPNCRCQLEPPAASPKQLSS